MHRRWRCIPSILSSFRRSSSTLVLRPYQEDCLDACTKALADGTTRMGVSLPTGAGKTTVFISLLSRIQPPATNKDATKSLIVVNSIELARQSASQVQRMFPDWVVELEQGAKHQATGDADVTIATYQTLSNEQRLRKFGPENLKAIIIDEAHHAAAPSYRRLLSQFDSEIEHPDGVQITPPPHKIPIIGFSATFSRHDGLALSSIFESIVYHRDFLEMIKEEWLCDVRFTSVKVTMDLEGVGTKGKNGDFVTSSLAKVVNTRDTNDLVVRSWIDRASERKSTLVFCVDIDHVKALTEAFRQHGIDARYVYAATPANQRKEIINSFKNGEFPVLINCAILTEGADIPNIDCVVLARPTRSRNLFSQMIGRGMRLSPNTGKEDCRIIDFVDNNHRVGGAVSIPTLFGLDPKFTDSVGNSTVIDIDDETPQSLATRIAALKAIPENADSDISDKVPPHSNMLVSPNRFVSVTYEDYDNAWEMDEEHEAADPTRIYSHFGWVNCGDNIHVLELPNKGFIRVEPSGDEDLFEVKYSRISALKGPNGFRTYYRPVSLVDTDKVPLSDAVRAADAFVQKSVFPNPALQMLILRFAKWRNQPASLAQKNYLIKRWKRDPNMAKKIDIVDEMSKGRAAAAITRLQHGIMGRHKARAKQAEKAESLALRAEQARQRESVKVGPLGR